MSEEGVASRRLALDALERIDVDGAYANILVPRLLDESGLSDRDRGLVTELVYGTTRMRRALDHLIDRYLDRFDLEPRVRAALRLGAYQLAFLGTPSHAAVDTAVAASPKRARGLVNAVLRRVAATPFVWPDRAIELSYPDWIVERLELELGDRALPVLEAMNRPASVHVRADGYRQDPASALVSSLMRAGDGSIVLDMCAAPGGKATAIAASGAMVVGSDIRVHRAGLVAQAAAATAARVFAIAADGTNPPFREASFDAVLVDAPCSGLGALRRRPDARWRIEPGDVEALARLQAELLESAARLVRPGGQVVYSVCTLTGAESTAVDELVAAGGTALEARALPSQWEPWGRGGRLLPDRFDGDGMIAFDFRRAA